MPGIKRMLREFSSGRLISPGLAEALNDSDVTPKSAIQ